MGDHLLHLGLRMRSNGSDMHVVCHGGNVLHTVTTDIIAERLFGGND